VHPSWNRALEAPLSGDLLRRAHRYWQAANYLTVGPTPCIALPTVRSTDWAAAIPRMTSGPRWTGNWYNLLDQDMRSRRQATPNVLLVTPTVR
jgi:hypothetical protein